MPRAIILVAVALGLGACAGTRPEGDVAVVRPPSVASDEGVGVGEAYRDFAGPRLDGGAFRLADVVGRKVVLLHFWGVLCAPCLDEIPFLSSLQERYAGAGLRVVGVNTDGVDRERLAGAMAAREVEPGYPVVLDPDLQASRHYTRWLIPVTVLLDRGGTVRFIHTGYRAEMDRTIEGQVKRLLNE